MVQMSFSFCIQHILSESVPQLCDDFVCKNYYFEKKIVMQKNVVVSGADGILGSAVVKRFSEKGYKVAGIYHRRNESVDSGVSLRIVADLMDEQATAKATQQILSEMESVDVLICTAGGFAMNTIENASAADIQKQLNLNFFTAYILVKAFHSHMKEHGYGRIFLTGSRQGLSPENGGQALGYTLSKSLLFALADALNADKESNIVVSVVVPSIIDTPANRESMPAADFSKWVSPKAIADVIAYYSSDEAAIIRQPVIKVFNHA